MQGTNEKNAEASNYDNKLIIKTSLKGIIKLGILTTVLLLHHRLLKIDLKTM